MIRVCTLLIIGACGAGPEPTPRPADPIPVFAADAGPTASVTPVRRRWIPGDLHVHVAPFDVREGASLTVDDLAVLGPKAGLEWVIMTPHVHPSTWSNPELRRAWLARWAVMAGQARAATAITIIPGTEFTVTGFGHFGVSGVDLATVGADFLASATARGGFVIVNHPYAAPTRIPGFAISHYDLSFRPWTTARGVSPHLDGVEAWNFPLGLANLISRRGGVTGEQRAWIAADELGRRERRPIAVVGGSDTHDRLLMPTTWVLAEDARESSIFAALRAGATCVGGVEAGTLEAHGDADPPGRWLAIGETVRATTHVELRWTGRGRLFVDGKDLGHHDGAFTHTDAAGVHTYRVEVGASRCGFVYANLATGG